MAFHWQFFGIIHIVVVRSHSFRCETRIVSFCLCTFCEFAILARAANESTTHIERIMMNSFQWLCKHDNTLLFHASDTSEIFIKNTEVSSVYQHGYCHQNAWNVWIMMNAHFAVPHPFCCRSKDPEKYFIACSNNKRRFCYVILCCLNHHHDMHLVHLFMVILVGIIMHIFPRK